MGKQKVILMKIGLIGLGRMGGNLTLNLKDHKHEVVVYDRNRENVDFYKEKGAIPSYSIDEMIKQLESPRIVWVMVTAGAATNAVIKELTPKLTKGDIIIDGGNTHYKETIKRANDLVAKGLKFLDVGTSGGVSGARNGACFMVGGDKKSFKLIEPILKDLSVPNGYGYFGNSGAGHFTKMIHNGIEYGMMQSIGEGMEIIEKSEFSPNLAKLADVWNHGSIIEGFLVKMMKQAYEEDKTLSDYTGEVGLSGEGEWTLSTAKELHVETPAIQASVDMRKKSKEKKYYQGKVIQALRFKFGGHTNTDNALKK